MGRRITKKLVQDKVRECTHTSTPQINTNSDQSRGEPRFHYVTCNHEHCRCAVDGSENFRVVERRAGYIIEAWKNRGSER